MRHDVAAISGNPKKVHDASLMHPTNTPYGLLPPFFPAAKSSLFNFIKK